MLDLIGTKQDTVFILTDFFAVEMDDPAVSGDEIDDTTCTFSTNPGQPTGYAAVAPDIGYYPQPPWGPGCSDHEGYEGYGIEWSGVEMSRAPTSLTHGTAGTNRARVEVDSAPEDAEEIMAEGTGSFTLTITCRDAETSVVGSSRIVVAN